MVAVAVSYLVNMKIKQEMQRACEQEVAVLPISSPRDEAVQLTPRRASEVRGQYPSLV
jgi:hypothetical protein